MLHKKHSGLVSRRLGKRHPTTTKNEKHFGSRFLVASFSIPFFHSRVTFLHTALSPYNLMCSPECMFSRASDYRRTIIKLPSVGYVAAGRVPSFTAMLIVWLFRTIVTFIVWPGEVYSSR